MKVNLDQVNLAAKMFYAKNVKVLATYIGTYGEYKQANKAYANLAVKDYNLSTQIPVVPVKPFPLFSAAGFNTMKNLFLDCFRIKTTDEIMLKKMRKAQQLKKEFEQLMFKQKY